MNKITELKPSELAAVNGGKLDYVAICAEVINKIVHIGVVGWQNWIEMKRIHMLKGSGDSNSWHAFNPSPSKMAKFMKSAIKVTKDILFSWKGSKDRFGCCEDGRFLDE